MKHTPREQQIANGLNRGELLGTLECGCVIIQDRTADAYIIYCSKHAAAPELLEACKGILLAAQPIGESFHQFEKTYIGTFRVHGNRLENLVAAIAKATE